ncbi:MAG: hypothetical protein KatS3mg044_0372 [Rhodothermaceae bacterium]|nr:MAG: hypothetical protein KatS3mg044_0372 [Rhodothermaceae bacterium]
MDLLQAQRRTAPRGDRAPGLSSRPRALLVVLWLAALWLPASAPAQVLPSFGGDRAGTSGFQFLKIASDARGAALGETVVASAFDASALFWNPALAAQLDGLTAGLHHTAYFVDVSLDYLAVTYHLPGPGLTLGASLQTLNSGEMDVTTEFEPFGTGERFRLLDLAAGLTLAQRLTDLFSYGVTGKYVRESVAGLTTSTFVFDLGFFYRVGDTGARMAVAIRNFGFDARPAGSLRRTVIGQPSEIVETEFESITPPTTFLFGLTYDVFHADARNDLLVSVQLNNPNDNAENWNVGLEYVWQRTLALRAGYRFGVEEYTLPGLGLGLYLPLPGPDLRFDYGFNRLERLGTIHRIGLNLSL